MVSYLVDNFDQRIRSLDVSSRKRFLHGVYKQLTESHKGRQTKGEYKIGVGTLHNRGETDSRTEFVVHVADALNQYGFSHQALRLLQQELLNVPYQRLKHTLSELEKADPQWRNHARLYVEQDGVQLDHGGYRNNGRFSSSIVLNGVNYGRGDGLFEIRPIFEGKTMEQLGPYDDVAGWLPLEKAIALAHAALRKDKVRFDQTRSTLYQ